MASVPHVDLRDHTDPDPARRDAMARALRDGMVEFGFVRVSGHGVDAALVERVHAAFERFFSLPDDARLRCAGVAGGQRGYTPYGIEHARDHPVPDLKDFFHVGQELPPGHRLHEHYPDNVWPDEVGDLRPACLALYRALEDASRRLLQAIAASFGLERDVFAAMIDDGNSILRGVHYPPVPPDADPRAIRAAPHEDINLVTLLCEATDAGLEILTRSGEWLAVDAAPGEIVADAGDMLARVTNDVVPSTTHRVGTPPGTAGAHRYALPFFAHPRPDCDLSVRPEFVAAGETPRHPPITAGDFLTERLREIGLVLED